jgi:hypothetical protein
VLVTFWNARQTKQRIGPRFKTAFAAHDSAL